MEKINTYREIGLPLKSIADVLERQESEACFILENQLININKKIQRLRDQQSIIVQIMEKEGSAINARVMTKEYWISILRATGLKDDDMTKWHVEFEKIAPESHQDFLESLGMGKQ
ncbi:MerR family transcriptional regulator, partial [Pseudomonadota bacterium]